MDEIKLNPQLVPEITMFFNNGKGLNDGYCPLRMPEELSLPTARAYMEEHQKIKYLMDLYSKLVYQDAEDLYAMVEEMHDLQDFLASSWEGAGDTTFYYPDFKTGR